MGNNMENHQVIARKWRPQKFGDVVGQTHVIRTLRNAIAGKRIGHAYLLVGPRGIGKTTIARIFAKAINCENPLDGEPCCQCSSCISLANESSLDVIEIDAASRNSVEHMRALSEEAYHMPVSSKYKIYIIDEVHMLSKAAWNALLKTVEEPPAHVKFIFATTEAHLVLPTIVSRCQRFDLRPIAGNLILNRLKLIAESEQVKIAPEALSAIARAAEGGMRDAQSSLEQMLAFFGGKDQEIAAEQVLELFGLTNAVELDTLLTALLQNQPGPVVSIVNQLAGRGRNLETLFDDILEMLRGTELVRILNNPEAVLDFETEKLERCYKLAQLTTPEVLRCFMEVLAPVGRTLHEALNKAIYLESILLKAMHEAHAPTIGDVLNRLNQLRSAGDLQFIEQVPDFSSRPAVPVMPVVLPETPPTAYNAPQPETPVTADIPTSADIPTAVVPEENTVDAVADDEITETVGTERASEALPDPVEVAVETSEKLNGELPEHEKLYKQLLQAVQSEKLDFPLADCQAVSFINSVLTLKCPAHVLGSLRAHRLKLLSLLQKISGNWAILLDFQQETVPEDSITEDAAVSVVPEDVYVESVPGSLPELPEFTEMQEISVSAEDTTLASDCGFQTVTAEVDIPGDSVDEGFVDLADRAEVMSDASPDETVLSSVDFAKRSVIHKPDEVETTAKLPPVQKVLDLFDGEIVDIHA